MTVLAIFIGFSFGCSSPAPTSTAPVSGRPEGEPTFVTVDRDGQPLEGVLVAFTQADGTPGPLARTDVRGRAAGLLGPGSTVSVIQEPDVLSIVDVNPGDVVAVSLPPFEVAGRWHVVGTEALWPGAERHAVSLGCGSRAPLLSDTSSATVFTPMACDLGDRVDVLGMATDGGGALLAAATIRNVDLATPLTLGAWASDLDEVTLDVPTPPANPLAITHLLGRRGQWFETVVQTVEDAGRSAVAVGAVGFADARGIEVRTHDDTFEAIATIRTTSAAPRWTLDPSTFAPAVEGRLDRDGWSVAIEAREVPDAIAFHLRLFIVTPEHDEPPARWDVLAPPDRRSIRLPDLPAVASRGPREFADGELTLLAGTIASPRTYRLEHGGRLDARDVTYLPEGLPAPLTLRRWSDWNLTE